jgi:hypothetical protein
MTNSAKPAPTTSRVRVIFRALVTDGDVYITWPLMSMSPSLTHSRTGDMVDEIRRETSSNQVSFVRALTFEPT